MIFALGIIESTLNVAPSANEVEFPALSVTVTDTNALEELTGVRTSYSARKILPSN